MFLMSFRNMNFQLREYYLNWQNTEKEVSFHFKLSSDSFIKVLQDESLCHQVLCCLVGFAADNLVWLWLFSSFERHSPHPRFWGWKKIVSLQSSHLFHAWIPPITHPSRGHPAWTEVRSDSPSAEDVSPHIPREPSWCLTSSFVLSWAVFLKLIPVVTQSCMDQM